jgi:tripartite-type tricarboxylate transporter receptor subunit TctC
VPACAVTIFGIVAPPGTPDVLADKINRDVVDCTKEPAFIEKAKALGMDLVASSRGDVARFFAYEHELWSKVIQQANIAPIQ